MSLVSLADMKTYLGEATTTYDDFLQAQLDLYSSAVENYCGRKFTQGSYVQTFYKSDFTSQIGELTLYHFPTITLTSIEEIVSVDGVDTETTTLSSYQYRLNDRVGTVKRITGGMVKNWFSELSYETRVDVTYEAGYATIPLEIDAVIKRLVEVDYNKEKSNIPLGLGPDVQSIAIPGVMNIAYDYSLQSNERKNKFGMLIGNYANVLDSFRSERVIIGELRDNYVS